MPKSNQNKAQMNANYEILAKKNKKLFEMNRRCLFSDVGCTSKPINSHLIQKAAILKIADKTNHVYSFFSPSFNEFNRIYSDAVYLPKKISASKASTFKGFCNIHDAELFGCIEKEEIKPTPKQLHALHLRAMARLYCNHEGLSKAIDNLLCYKYLNELNIKTQLLDLADERKCRDRSRQRIIKEKKALVSTTESSISKMQSYIFLRLKEVPNIMCSAKFVPTFNFNGDILTINDIPKVSQFWCVTISSDIKGGYVILQWNEEDELIKQVVSSFCESHFEINKLLAMCMLFSNFIFQINWWDTLKKDEQEIIMHFAMNSYFKRKLNDLDVPRKMYKHFLSKKIRLVNWTIIDKQTNSQKW